MPDDLVTGEGVDEGSAAQSTEGDAGPDPSADPVGPAGSGGPARAAGSHDAPPLPPSDQDAPAGQQLAEGEG